MEFVHIPVLFEETIASLDVRADGIYVDCTAGGGNHSAAILARLGPEGRLICLDRDPDAIAAVNERFRGDARVRVVHTRYSAIGEVLDSLGIPAVDGILMDIGVSSHQVDTAERGFSFHKDAPLDMRMSQEGVTAADLCNTMTWQQLAEIFSRYGEEKFSVRIAKAICAAREKRPIDTTFALAEIISDAVPAAAKRSGHPGRRVFQALRIAVNDELGELERGLQAAFEKLAPEGRLSVITFHSLEDRIVKQTMAKWCEGCTCPPEFPVCVCGNTPKARLLHRKPTVPSPEELERNPRSRSSKLRTCVKIEN